MPELELEKPIQTKEFRIWKAVAISEGIVLIIGILSAFKIDIPLKPLFYLVFGIAGVILGYYLFYKKQPMNYLELIKVIRTKYQEVININDYEAERLTQTRWAVYFPREAYSIVWDSFTNEFWRINKTLSQIREDYIKIKPQLEKHEERRRGRLKELGIDTKEDLKE